MHYIIKRIEIFLRRLRYIILLPIFFVCATLVYLIVLMGSRFWNAIQMFDTIWEQPFQILWLLIDVIDIALLCVIALIIIRWLYEIFLNRLAVQSKDQNQADQILIHDIDELKQKLGKVIIISLIVHVFKHMILFVVYDKRDLVAIAAAVPLLALWLYLVEKLGSSTNKKHKISNK